MALERPNDTTILHEAITNALKSELDIRYAEFKEILIKQLDRDKDMILAGIALSLEKLVSYQTINENLVITVHTKPL